MEINDLMNKYLNDTAVAREKMRLQLFGIFVETTGHRPEDVCMVEQQIKTGFEYKTLFYFDLKTRHQTGE